jgi:hypothetical protein
MERIKFIPERIYSDKWHVCIESRSICILKKNFQSAIKDIISQTILYKFFQLLEIPALKMSSYVESESKSDNLTTYGLIKEHLNQFFTLQPSACLDEEREYAMVLSDRISTYIIGEVDASRQGGGASSIAAILAWISCVALHPHSKLNNQEEHGCYYYQKKLPNFKDFFIASGIPDFHAFFTFFTNCMNSLHKIFHANEAFRPIFFTFKSLSATQHFLQSSLQHLCRLMKLFGTQTVRDLTFIWLLYSTTTLKIYIKSAQNSINFSDWQSLVLLVYIASKVCFSRDAWSPQITLMLTRDLAENSRLNFSEKGLAQELPDLIQQAKKLILVSFFFYLSLII